MDVHFFAPDGAMQTDVHTENTDVNKVGFHPPFSIIGSVWFLPQLAGPSG